MSTNNKTAPAFTFRFIETRPKFLLELTNATDQAVKSVEILTIFFRDEVTPGGGPSQSHIRFDGIKSIQPKEKTVLSHRTWINGRPADDSCDQMERLQVIAGQPRPYVLDISWENEEGKARFQRIQVGH